eukprot:6899163-Pyramimonas_sp.AAC.3
MEKRTWGTWCDVSRLGRDSARERLHLKAARGGWGVVRWTAVDGQAVRAHGGRQEAGLAH